MGGGEVMHGEQAEGWRVDGGWRGGGGVGIGTYCVFVLDVMFCEVLGRMPLGPCLWP